MDKIIEIAFNKIVIEAILNDSITAQKVVKVLPMKSRINLWGEEVYFEIPVEANIENGKEIMDIGNISFWPPVMLFAYSLDRLQLAMMLAKSCKQRNSN